MPDSTAARKPTTADNRDDGAPAPTNVFQLFNAVDLTSTTQPQLSRYQAGVGTEGILDKILGGLLGSCVSSK